MVHSVHNLGHEIIWKKLLLNIRISLTKYAVGLVVIYTRIYTGETIVGVIESRQDGKFQRVLLE
jgi:hypothetical protein